MKTIHTLVPDIQKIVTNKDGWFDDNTNRELSSNLAVRLGEHFNYIQRPSLRLSQMGPRCPRALWYSIHHHELREALPPWAEVKYAFGHVIEALAITLAKAAGHEVTGEQDELELMGVLGHRDCVIDGCTVDVKSTSSIGFSKFKDGSIVKSDSFGYLDQLDGYVVASANDPLVRVKDKGYILAIDKQLGHMVCYEHKIQESRIRARIEAYKRIVALVQPPACECGTIPEGSSGNIRLDTKGSYSSFKHCCFPNLRTFLYSKGPVYLTHVVKKPDVVEVDRNGKIVYN